MKDPPPRSNGSDLLPPMISYQAVAGSDGLWTATVDTRVGRISATRHSLHETFEALESQVREATRRER